MESLVFDGGVSRRCLKRDGGKAADGGEGMGVGRRKLGNNWSGETYFLSFAAKILANLIVMGSGILVRGLVQAYRQALQNASKSGVAQETLQNAVHRGSKVMTEQEARQILGLTYPLNLLQKYDNLFERNAKNGSFYLQSKVHRAKECLETFYQAKDEPGGPVG
ncbi:Mitochondrial import inner membrane translocase subunit Tim16 [Cynara cardunculus var. scolymus]|uniref:Mitochondrial import inner membrane translocase subunit Tim16 n=1 Tax=Cynara cardunculus var. scolymus TaxID=59895 RepID=A0A118JUE9_CYNCS|nr:Mitochondrial import inner membrane translocase subunit Tim16 [Cynara cardunculus var. scolymus]